MTDKETSKNQEIKYKSIVIAYNTETQTLEKGLIIDND